MTNTKPKQILRIFRGTKKRKQPDLRNKKYKTALKVFKGDVRKSHGQSLKQCTRYYTDCRLAKRFYCFGYLQPMVSEPETTGRSVGLGTNCMIPHFLHSRSQGQLFSF